MRDLICEHCEKNFHHYFEEWELHMQMAHNKRPVMQCRECDAVLVGLDEFDRHQEFEHRRMITSLSLLFKEAKREMVKQ